MERKNMLKAQCRASFTIEASFIVPLIIFGIIVLVWCVFYLRNSVKVTADADYFMFMLESDAAENRNKGFFEKEIKGKENAYFGAGSSKAELSRNGKDIEVKILLQHDLPEEGIIGKIVSGIREVNIENKETVSSPSEISRFIMAAGELVNRILEITGVKGDEKEEADEGNNQGH